jgi:hypothetical protein
LSVGEGRSGKQSGGGRQAEKIDRRHDAFPNLLGRKSAAQDYVSNLRRLLDFTSS